MQEPVTLDMLEKLVKEDKLHRSLAIHYLNIYVSEEVDWEDKINKKYTFFKKQNAQLNAEELSEKFRKVLAATILIPASYAGLRRDLIVEDFIFGVEKFHQFNDKDWFAELKKVAARDIEIQEFRKEIVKLGVIPDIQYHPYYRQAFNWLVESAQNSGDLTPENKENIHKSMKSIVVRYGGMVVSSLFTRHKEVVSNIVNWRSGYFVERALFRVYKTEEMLKIKQIELSEAPQRLVQKINAG